MTPIAAVGGPTRLGAPEFDPVSVGGRLRVTYGRSIPRGRVYHVALAPSRLTALIVPTADGFVARCPELESLGYGREPETALENLIGATREYLAFLAEDQPPLAPEVAHHAAYVSLLDAPDGAWFVAITGFARPAPDAS